MKGPITRESSAVSWNLFRLGGALSLVSKAPKMSKHDKIEKIKKHD